MSIANVNKLNLHLHCIFSIRVKMLLLIVILFVLSFLSLLSGSVRLPLSEVVQAIAGSGTEEVRFIIVELRFPQMFTAILTGAALAISGMLMQTLFENPLADPSLLGINSGASLGAAIALLLLGGSWTIGEHSLSGVLLTVIAAFVGACMVNAFLVACSKVLRGNLALLVAGVMLSFIISAVISMLNFYATADGVRSYVVWSMGDFSNVSLNQLPILATLTILPICCLIGMVSPLNALLLGTDYATNLGVNVRSVRTLMLLITGLLTASVTAMCGPISFIGLAVPHMARMLFPTADHKYLIPSCLLIGANVALLSLIISHLPGERGVLPLAAITPLLGVPVVFYILISSRR